MSEDTPSEKPRPLDAERQRLRASGLTDAEISQFFVARALRDSERPSGPPGGGGDPGGPPVHPQGVFSNVINSIIAVASHAGGLLTSIPHDIATILDRSTTGSARSGAFAAIAGKAVVIGALAYLAAQEWQQHVISAPKTAAITVDLTEAQATKAKEDAKVAAEVAAGQAAQAKKAEEEAKVAAEVARGQAAHARIEEANAENAEELAKGQKAQACNARLEQITL